MSINNMPVESIRLPAGIKLLRLFYISLFFANAIVLSLFSQFTFVKIFGITFFNYADVIAKIMLALLPLIIFYYGFIKFSIAGYYIAIIYQSTFFLNALLTVLGRVFKIGIAVPIVQIIGNYPPSEDKYLILRYSIVYSLNLIFGTMLIYYLVSKLEWYRGDKAHQGYEDRLVDRYKKEFEVTYCVSSSGVGICTKGYSSDIGTTGIQFVATKPLQKGTKVDLDIKLPNRPEPIYTKAKIIWSEGTKCGAQFVRISISDRKKLKNFLKGQ